MVEHVGQQGGLVYFRLVIVAVQRAELVQGGLEPFRREHIRHVQRDGHRLTRVRSLHLVLPAVLGVTVSAEGDVPFAPDGLQPCPVRVVNQDRAFNARLRLWKEGWWKSWTPQIVLGLDDPTSHEAYGGGAIKFDEDGMQNNHFTRYYLAATKHFSFTGVGTLGVHAAYVDYRACWFPHYRRPAAGVNFKFNLLPEDNLAVKALNGLDLMAEYDARTVNIGAHYQLWKDHINLIAELNNGKYFSGGIYFKIHLK
ncbi:hypothetical protein [Phocaeicola dorei]|uniref:hypothetical protein n=1 Tax=Phocaeicola dorei TaxID=357276 RepID=UPI0028F70E02|nr:hypothetical protein [Phocaeicola dorei]